jgi:membrane fusion protein, heavy metal efflux system
MSRRILALLTLLSVAAVYLWAHEGHQALPTKGIVGPDARGKIALSAEARAALGVQTAEVKLQELDDQIAAPAQVVAPWQRQAYATTRLPGKIAAIHVQPGQVVRAGQTLADVQSLELESLQLEFLSARNDTALSEENLKEVETAVQKGAVSEQQVLEAKAKDQENRNALEIALLKLSGLGVAAADEKQLPGAGSRARAALDTLPIKSPIAGVVIHADVQVGQVVEPSQHLFEIVDLSAVWTKIGVLEKDLSRLAAGQPLALHLTAYPTETFRGNIQTIGNALDSQTGLAMAWAELSNSDGRLLPGMYGQAEIRLSAREKRKVVPETAVLRVGAERFVLVEEGPGQYVRQNVVVGRAAGGLVEVRDGELYPGDRLLTTGSHELAPLFSQGILRLSREAERSISLRVEPAKLHTLANVVQIPGAIDLPPGRHAVVASRLPGTIARIAIDRDQAVHAGDVIAEVASLELQNLQLDLLRSHLDMDLQEQILERLRPLSEAAAVPRRRLREAQSAHNAASLRRASARRKLIAAGLSEQQVDQVLHRRKLTDSVPLRAPIDGVVVRFQAALGQVVKAEDALFEIHDLGGAQVRGFVSEPQASAVQIGRRARVRLLGDPTFVADATVVRSDQVFGAIDRTLSIWAEPKELAPRHLLNGMLAELSLVLSESAPVLALPRAAILREGMHTCVFVRGNDGIFERRPIDTGRTDDSFVEITQGLKQGETVAVQGVAELQTAYAAIR